MLTPVNDQLRREIANYKLRFACEHCGAWDPEKDACAEGYPTAPHRERMLNESALAFCKAFEST